MLKETYIEQTDNLIKKRIINRHNKRYIIKESKNKFFDNVLNYSLDYTQRKCILTDDRYVLIVAGAGSGKSLTIVGKIEYLIKIKKIDPTEILCISFTNEATLSLKRKIKEPIDIKTFHKLGISILETNGFKINIASPDTLDKIIDRYLNEYLKYDENLLEDVIKYLTKYININNYDKNENIYTIIKEYLDINNIKYTEDMYLIDYKIYIKIKNKKDKNINLPYYTYEDGTLLDNLYKQLKSKNIELNPDYNKIKANYNIYFIKIKKLINTFITLYKSNNYQPSYLDEIIKENTYEINNKIKHKNRILLMMIKKVYTMYQDYLSKNDLYDFDDLINKSIDILDDGFIKPYKYIIIDEYQDTSFTKYELIKKIINKTDAKLFVVGDDFQSIYRFTGCNLEIFTNFKKYYPNSQILKIERTYRNSQQLIDVAGNFILKNKLQINKKLVTDKLLDKPIKIYLYDDIKKTIKKIIENITTDILILGRNNSDLKLILDNEIKQQDEYIIYKNKKIRFLTVHKSKGLEEENVIVINISDNILGFPCKMTDDPILKYLNKSKDYYPFEEERRLFYVALTRTKNYVYLLAPKKNPSIFIKEIMHDKNVSIVND